MPTSAKTAPVLEKDIIRFWWKARRHPFLRYAQHYDADDIVSTILMEFLEQPKQTWNMLFSYWKAYDKLYPIMQIGGVRGSRADQPDGAVMRRYEREHNMVDTLLAPELPLPEKFEVEEFLIGLKVYILSQNRGARLWKVIVWYFLEGYDQREIGKKLDVSQVMVVKILQRARRYIAMYTQDSESELAHAQQ